MSPMKRSRLAFSLSSASNVGQVRTQSLPACSEVRVNLRSGYGAVEADVSERFLSFVIRQNRQARL